MPIDALIVGGGPAGLAAALTLGRACKRVRLYDSGPRRNAAATQIHNFVTRDGASPQEFRQVGRAQLEGYATVEVRDGRVEAIDGARDGFEVRTTEGTVQARRILLCTGMIDERLDIPGFDAAWGRSIFQCPYCHGFEVRGRRWGYLAHGIEGIQLGFPAQLRSWTDEVTVFTNGAFELPGEEIQRLQRLSIGVERRPISRLVEAGGQLTHVELGDGARIPCDVLYAHPPQRQVPLVESLGLDADELGYVRADPMTRQTSRPGVYAAGDLTTRLQGAIFAAAAGSQAAAMINHDLSLSAFQSTE